jgi:protein SCO1/2
MRAAAGRRQSRRHFGEPVLNSARIPLIVLAVAALGFGAWVASRSRAPAATALQGGILLATPRPIAPFTLLDQDGKPFANAQLQGHWTLLFPGFTHCPDVCPTTLSMLKLLQQRMQAQAPAMVFLSVDPERDTPAALKPYVRFFSPDITGLSGPLDELNHLCENLGVAYVKVPGKSPGDYSIDHSAALVLIDPQGRVAGYFTPPYKVDTLAADLARLPHLST